MYLHGTGKVQSLEGRINLESRTENRNLNLKATKSIFQTRAAVITLGLTLWV